MNGNDDTNRSIHSENSETRRLNTSSNQGSPELPTNQDDTAVIVTNLLMGIELFNLARIAANRTPSELGSYAVDNQQQMDTDFELASPNKRSGIGIDDEEEEKQVSPSERDDIEQRKAARTLRAQQQNALNNAYKPSQQSQGNDSSHAAWAKMQDQHKPTYEKLLKYKDENHPRKLTVKKDGKHTISPYSLCASTGFFNASEDSEFDFSLGINLYFKYVKAITLVFLLMGILNLPSVLLFMSISQESGNMPLKWLYDTTYAKVGPTISIASSLSYTGPPQDIKYTLTLQCLAEHRLENIQSISYSNLSPSQSTLSFEQWNRTMELLYQEERPDSNQTCREMLLDKTKITDECIGKNNCSTTFKAKDLQELGCQLNLTNEISTVGILERFELNNYSKLDVFEFLIYWEIVKIVVFEFSLVWLNYENKKTIRSYQKAKIDASNYTIQIKNFPQNESALSILAQLVEHFEQNFSYLAKPNIADLNYILDSSDVMDMRKRIGELKQEVFKSTVQIYNIITKLYDTEAKIYILSSQNEAAPVKSEKINNQIEKLKENHLNIYLETKINENKLQKYQNGMKDQLHTVYITFEDPKMVDGICSVFNESSHSSMCKFKGKNLKVARPPPPSNVKCKLVSNNDLKQPLLLGGNLTVSKFELLMRQLYTLLLTVILLSFSFGLQAYVQYQIDLIDTLGINSQCNPNEHFTQDQVGEMWNSNQGALYCYCMNKYPGETITDKMEAAKDSFFSFQQYKCNSSEISEQNPYFYYQSHSPCYDLFVEAEPITPSMQTFFFYGQLIGTLFFNVVIETSFAEVATYLRKSSLSRELRSASTKIFISQFLNTAVLPLLAKSTAVMTFIRSIPLFAPREEIYQTMCEKQVIMESADDATFLGIKWYINYGSNMLFILILNCFLAHFETVMKFIKRKCKRFYDRKFTCDIRKTRKILQKDYDELYLGLNFPIDGSYAIILSNLFTCFIYSTGLPLAYFIGAFGFLIVYWWDKYQLLRFYKNPPALDEKLSKRALALLQLSIVLHLVLAICMLGNEQLFPGYPAAIYHGGTEASFKEFKIYDMQQLRSLIIDNPHYQPQPVKGLWATLADFFIATWRNSRRPGVKFLTYIGAAETAILLLYFLRVVAKKLIKAVWDTDDKKDRYLKERQDLESDSGQNEKLLRETPFWQVVSDYYVKERLNILKNTTLPAKSNPAYEKLMADLRQKFEQEYVKRKRLSKNVTKFLNGVPFYCPEMDPELKEVLGHHVESIIRYQALDESKLRKAILPSKPITIA